MSPSDMSDRQPPIYRAYRVSPGGRVSTVPIILEARNDEEATVEALGLVDGVGIEVWDRARCVIALPPKGKSNKAVPD